MKKAMELWCRKKKKAETKQELTESEPVHVSKEEFSAAGVFEQAVPTVTEQVVPNVEKHGHGLTPTTKLFVSKYGKKVHLRRDCQGMMSVRTEVQEYGVCCYCLREPPPPEATEATGARSSGCIC